MLIQRHYVNPARHPTVTTLLSCVLQSPDVDVNRSEIRSNSSDTKANESGDKNTKLYHASASKRRRTNKITKLKDYNGEWREWNDDLEDLIVNYYKEHFSATQVDVTQILDSVSSSITGEQNDKLLKDGVLPAELNTTNVVLIPKKNPSEIGDLRPIFPCNILVKVITKVIANRTKEFLKDVISENQSAFIPGRLISDNILISYKSMHYLKRKKRGEEGFMALKLDMSKAYDRIEWDYLRAILLTLDFHEWWVQLIMQCICSVKYKVVHGLREMGSIVPTRGIRQGDPLSPYLFILCTEGLSAIIRKYETQKLIRGIKICRGALTLTHMFFADDSYIYCQANTIEASNMTTLLHKFKRASGQKVNFEKTSIFFSPKTISSNKEEVCRVLHMQEADEMSKYLGLPDMLSRNKSAIPGFQKDKVKNQVRGWDGRYVVRSVKEILIKFVAQTLPSCAMSVFLLPFDVIKDIERTLAKYWWGSKPDRNGKQGWRFLFNPESLVSPSHGLLNRRILTNGTQTAAKTRIEVKVQEGGAHAGSGAAAPDMQKVLERACMRIRSQSLKEIIEEVEEEVLEEVDKVEEESEEEEVIITMGNPAASTIALREYSQPKIMDIQSSIVRPTIVANTFEIKPGTIQMV
ncbi:hypothetical protein AgCh_010202 [Apium graveolens]